MLYLLLLCSACLMDLSSRICLIFSDAVSMARRNSSLLWGQECDVELRSRRVPVPEAESNECMVPCSPRISWMSFRSSSSLQEEHQSSAAPRGDTGAGSLGSSSSSTFMILFPWGEDHSVPFVAMSIRLSAALIMAACRLRLTFVIVL